MTLPAKAFCDRTSRFMQFQGSSETLIEKLLRFETDVVLISDAFEEVPGLARTLVLEEPSVLVLPDGMDPVIGKTWNSLRHCGLPMISSTENSGAGRINDRFLSSMRMSFPTKYEAESDAVMIEIIRSGAAWALTRPTTVLSAGGTTEGITVAPMPEPEFSRKLYIVTRGGEFEAESADIHSVCKRTLCEAVLPKLARIAPWTTPKAY